MIQTNDDIASRTPGFLPGLYQALIAPDRSFGRENLFTVSRFLLFGLIFALVFAGSVLTQKFMQNETMQTLSIAETTRRIEKMMANAPKERRDEAIQRAIQTQSSGRLSVMMVVRLVFGPAIWLAFVLEVWFLGIILMQFFGGEEKPVGTKKHRRSLYLALYGVAPLAFQALIRGLVYFFKDPTAIGNVLTLDEYMEAAEVSFSLIALLGIGGLAGFAKYLAHNLTNPFCLWALAVAFFGGRSVFAVRSRKIALAVFVIFVLVGLQGRLFTMITGMFGG